MTQGNEFVPFFDNLMGVFRWFRLSDEEVTLMETGSDAIELRDWCETATPEQIDERAREAFEEEGL